MFLSVKKVEEARADLLADCDSIRMVAESEGRELTADEAKTLDAKLDRHQAMEADLDRAKKYEDAKRQSMLKNAKPITGAPAIHVRENADDKIEPVRGDSQIFNAKVWGSQQLAAKAATDVGHYLRATLLENGNDDSKRYLEDRFGQSMSGQFMGQSVQTPADGGYLVPEVVSSAMLEALQQYGVGINLMRRVPMAGIQKLYVPIHKGSLTVVSPGESTQIGDSKTTFDRVALDARDYYCLNHISTRLLSTSVTGVADYVVREMGRGHAATIDKQFVLGDAVAGTPYFGVRGLVNVAGALVQEAGGNSWTDFDAADFSAAVGKLPSVYWEDGGPVWLMSRSFYHSVVEPLLEAGGGNSKSDIAMASPRTLKGIPIVFSEAMPSATATNQVSAVLCNPRYTHLFGDIQGVSVQSTDQLRFDYDDVSFRSKMSYAITQVVDFSNAIVKLKTAA